MYWFAKVALTKYHPLGGLCSGKVFIVSLFWRVELQDQGVSRVTRAEGCEREICSTFPELLVIRWQPLAFLDPQKHHRDLCLRLLTEIVFKFPFFIRTIILPNDLRSCPKDHFNLIIKWKDPHLQVKSHSEVLTVRTPPYLLWGT